MVFLYRRDITQPSYPSRVSRKPRLPRPDTTRRVVGRVDMERCERRSLDQKGTVLRNMTGLLFVEVHHTKYGFSLLCALSKSDNFFVCLLDNAMHCSEIPHTFHLPLQALAVVCPTNDAHATIPTQKNLSLMVVQRLIEKRPNRPRPLIT